MSLPIYTPPGGTEILFPGGGGVVAPEPNTVVLRGPLGEGKFGEPREPEDAARLKELGEMTRLPGNVDVLATILAAVASGAMIPGKGYVFTRDGGNVSGLPNGETGEGIIRFFLDRKPSGIVIVVTYRKHTSNNVFFENVHDPESQSWLGWKRIDSGGAFPAGAFVEMSVPASGTSAVAPEDGYIHCSAGSTAIGGKLSGWTGGNALPFHAEAYKANQNLCVWLPVCKGRTFHLDYSNVHSVVLRFTKSIGAS